MPAPPETQPKKTGPPGQDDAAQDISAEVERLVRERMQESRKENEALRRENIALQERVEEYRDLHGHKYQEVLNNAQTYSEELAAANEELRLTNEELHQINETLNAQRDELIAARETAETERRRYYDLFDAAPDGYLVTDRNGTILEANQAAQSLLAVHRESLKNRSLIHFVAEESRGEFRTQLARAAGGRPRQDFELQLRPLEREPVCASVSIAAVHPDEAEVPSLRWMVRDITDRKRAEEALRESEERYRTVIETTEEGFVTAKPNGPYTFVNRRMAEMLGYPVEEILGKSSVDFTFDTCVPNVFRSRTALHEGNRDRGEFRFRRKDGSELWTQYNATPMFNEQGEHIANFVFHTDITERKLAEEALLESEARLAAVLASLPVGIWIADSMGRVTAKNEAADLIWGGDAPLSSCPEDYVEYIAWDGETGKPLEADDYPLARALRTGLPTTPVELRIRRFDGTEGFILMSTALLRGPDGLLTGAVGINVDITDRKRAEEALVRRTEDLARLQSDLETTNREANLYLDILTHDIRNTENVSNLYAELLADTLDGEAAGYLEKLRRSINKSIEILSTVSTIRRIHRASSGLKPMDLNAAIRSVIEDFPGSTIRYDGVPYSVMADDLLSVIFDNLIGNAAKHGGPGVAIAVRAEERDGEVLVSIEDTGPGVPDADKDAIFHRYEQKKRGVGEGLGLYLVQILVERYGGNVWVEDRVPGRSDEGAAFRFTLRKSP